MRTDDRLKTLGVGYVSHVSNTLIPPNFWICVQQKALQKREIIPHKNSTHFKLESFSLEKGKVGIKACFFTLFFLYRKCIQVLNILEGI